MLEKMVEAQYVILAIIIALPVGLWLGYLLRSDGDDASNAISEPVIHPSLLLRQCLTTFKQRHISFAAIRTLVGGYTDDELRAALIGAGAIRLIENDGSETWGLLSRNKARLNKKMKILVPEDDEVAEDTEVDKAEAAPDAKELKELKEEAKAQDSTEEVVDLAAGKSIQHEQFQNFGAVTLTNRAEKLNHSLRSKLNEAATTSSQNKKNADLKFMIGRVEKG